MEFLPVQEGRLALVRTRGCRPDRTDTRYSPVFAVALIHLVSVTLDCQKDLIMEKYYE